MDIIQHLIASLVYLSQETPIELFILLGSFLEEIIAPIPSPVVMTTAGALAAAQKAPIYILIYLAALGAASKTFGSWIWYLASDKSGNYLVSKTQKYTGVTLKDIDKVKKYISGGYKDFFIIVMLRAIPAIPTAPVSLAAGVLKLKVKSYLIATFIGNCIRDTIFLYIGYSGLNSAEKLLSGLAGAETVAEIIILILLCIAVIWLYYRRTKKNKK